jgi:hypothetical protein
VWIVDFDGGKETGRVATTTTCHFRRWLLCVLWDIERREFDILISSCSLAILLSCMIVCVLSFVHSPFFILIVVMLLLIDFGIWAIKQQQRHEQHYTLTKSDIMGHCKDTIKILPLKN